MACLQIRGSGNISPLARIRPVLLRRRFPALTAPFRCCLQDDGNSGSSGEEPPESLFTKELKRRGLTPTSLLEEGVAGRAAYPGLREEVEFEQEERSGGGRGRGPRKQNGVGSADYHMGLENQRERSMALNGFNSQSKVASDSWSDILPGILAIDAHHNCIFISSVFSYFIHPHSLRPCLVAV